ncbi:hypothetical protein SPRG_10906 [Saprolegnia parasitica CBS 223.65]|uniref:Uncharacterized protein n=1 Tax=Saprolegnia parasitica (strain CBS 223.65) TaxID=695850 RepID=A0A067C0R7_SAPPC|nr:hypothetical protein SPRG_10906 [Saprolegnia parasitica CBS 223.65]KDO24118.1 hypothetical protein SPRG_10906 [Saprolegnia parasitica CBS 223.65]|eukprot:XP_012205253.1 hypothetical protein SPRG_10906 [Saprolegnia parasitica CBS 223.65]
MTSSPEKQQPTPAADETRSSFLKVFWDLAELNVATRTAAVEAIVSHLRTANDADELNYTLKRLIRGLASSRDAARQGFSTALTAVLHAFPSLDLAEVFATIKSTMDISSSMKGMEQREHMFGRLFGILALQQSLRLEDEDLITALVTELLTMAKWKKWFRESCLEAVLSFVVSMTPATFTTLLPLFSAALEGPVASFNADQVAFAIGLHEYLASHKLLKTHASLVAATILDRHHMARLVEPLKASSTVCYPRVHSSWRRLLDHFFASPKLDEERFQEAWTVLIDGMLIGETSTHERRGTAFKLFELIVAKVPGPTLRSILTPRFVKCLYNNAVSKKTYLHEAAVASLQTFAAKNPIEFYHFLQHHFAQPLTSLVSPLDDDATESDPKPTKTFEFEAVMAMEEEKERKEYQAKRIAGARMWALDTMYTATQTLPSTAEDKVWSSVLSFLLEHAFYTHTKKAKKTTIVDPAVSENVTAACGKRVYALMGLGSHALKGSSTLEQSVPFRLWATWAEMDKKKDLALVEPLTKEHAAKKAIVNAQIASLSTQLKAATDKKEQLKLKGFMLLSVCVGLQLLDASSRDEAASVLDDLERCLKELNAATKPKKKSPAKKGKKASEDDEVPQPLTVLTDMMLSMLAQESSVMREIVNHVFRSIMDQLDATSLQSMLDVVTAPEESSMLSMGDDDDDDDDEGAPIDPTQLTQPVDMEVSSNDDEQNDDDDDEEEEISEEAALSELQREDAALSALVNNVVEKKKAKQQAKRLKMAALHFKVRVLDLLHAYAAGTGPHAAMLIAPLFTAWTSTKASTDLIVWSERLGSVLTKLTKRKDGHSNDRAGLKAALESVLTTLGASMCEKKQASVAATVIVYLVRQLTKDGKTADVAAILAPIVTLLLTKKHQKMPRVVFDDLVAKAPVQATTLLFPTLAGLCVDDSAVDDFNRAEVARYVTALVKTKGMTLELLSPWSTKLQKACLEAMTKVKGKRLKGVAACGQALLKARMDLKDTTLDALALADELKALDAASPVVKGMVAQMLQLLGGPKAPKDKKRKRTLSQ